MPKFSHAVKYLKPDHPAYDVCKLCSKELKKDRELKAVKKLYNNRNKCKTFEARVYDSLSTEDQSIIGEKNIWVQVKFTVNDDITVHTN